MEAIQAIQIKGAIQHKGFTIVEDYRNPYSKEPEFMFFPTKEGVQHDADGDSEGFRYCGNCDWASTLEDAYDLIDEKIMSVYPAWHLVETVVDTKFRMTNITKFSWLGDAVQFANRYNGALRTRFESI